MQKFNSGCIALFDWLQKYFISYIECCLQYSKTKVKIRTNLPDVTFELCSI